MSSFFDVYYMECEGSSRIDALRQVLEFARKLLSDGSKDDAVHVDAWVSGHQQFVGYVRFAFDKQEVIDAQESEDYRVR